MWAEVCGLRLVFDDSKCGWEHGPIKQKQVSPISAGAATIEGLDSSESG